MHTFSGLPAAIQYPGYKNGVQNFPFRTFSMILTIFVLWSTSIVSHVLFQRGVLKARHDIAHVFIASKEEIKPFSFADMLVTEGVKINAMVSETDEEGACDGEEGSSEKVNGNCADEEVELMKRNNNGNHHDVVM